ncbi:MAG: cobalamin B12-binding domain-containing protein [Candidatus Methylomirabilia bacterium]
MAASRGDPHRVLLAKMGLDSHDHGVRVMAKALASAGFEVIYQGTHNRPEQVARAATEESADVVGLSFLSGEHLANCRQLLPLLRRARPPPLVIVGGVIPPNDLPKLKRLGVARVFGPGTMPASVIRFLRERLKDEA